MTPKPSNPTPFLLLAAALLAGCSGGGDSAAPGAKATLEIVSCSLGCSASETGIACGPLNIHVNEEIAIEFNDAVDIDTVTKNTFQMVEIGTGAVPAASFFLDPANPRRLIYRPSLTFDSQGNPVFGLTAGSTYRLTIPGSQSDAGPSQSFIQSTSGRTNARRLQCTLSATEGVNDLRQGSPSVDVFFDVVQNDGTVEREVLANATPETVLTDVAQDTTIKLVFDDVMNPATVVNPVTGDASLIDIGIDPDGNAQDSSDQVPFPGSFTIALDQENVMTTVTFVPDLGLPSGKSGSETRLLVVNLPTGIVDLGGNNLQNGGFVSGVPQEITFQPMLLPDGEGENFADTSNRDDARTGADWGPLTPGDLQGALSPGLGGGSGRLGDLMVLPAEEPTVFDTDSQTFEGPSLLTTFDDVTGEPEPITVTDGVFEFANVFLAPGSVLRVQGSQPARVFARGTMLIQGRLDVSGESLDPFPSLPCDVTITDPEDPLYCAHLDPDLADCGAAVDCPDGMPHGDGDGDLTEAEQKAYLDSQGLLPEFFRGQAGGAGGAAGGAGGKGGDLPGFDAGADPSLAASNGLNNLNDTMELDGSDGEGIPYPNTIDALGTTGGGGGGLAFPDFPDDGNDSMALTIPLENNIIEACLESRSGSAGAGAANSSDGSPPVNNRLGGGPNDAVAAAVGGDMTLLEFSEDLDPFGGFLRGGAGGGGSGAHVADTRPNGEQVLDCYFEDEPPLISDYRQSRGSGGGGGGGAVQVQAGRRLVIDGVVDASGGSGGGTGSSSPFGDRLDNVTAGGSGAGGSILAQSEQVEISQIPGRLRVNGGERAQGLPEPELGTPRSRGGHGGSGRVRVESGLTPATLLDEDTVESTVLPSQADLDSTQGPFPNYINAPTLDELVSVANWTPLEPGDLPPGTSAQPELRSGAQSCWMKPAGNVFFTRFFEDTGSELGWDMNVFLSGLNLERSWREDDELLAALGIDPPTWESLLGSQVGVAPVVVRFQGARAIGAVPDPCDVAESGPETPLLPASITPWVSHPSELNDVNDDEALRPNLIRFQVVFDGNADFSGIVLGVTHLSIRAQGE